MLDVIDPPVPFDFWLARRYPLDARARSLEVEKDLLARFAGHKRLRIVDLGSGLGANTRYYGERFGCDQEWILIDHDASLVEPALRSLSAWAQERGGRARRAPEGLEVRMPDGRALSIRLIVKSIADLDSECDLFRTDLVAASALLDLLTRGQLESLTGQLGAMGIPLLATLNYDAMRFDPEEREDEMYVLRYEAHMSRPRRSGRALGPRCSPALRQALRNASYLYSVDASRWSLGPEDIEVSRLLLGFLGRALMEQARGSDEEPALGQWLRGKRDALREGRLRIEVLHSDFFCVPAGARGGRNGRPLTATK